LAGVFDGRADPEFDGATSVALRDRSSSSAGKPARCSAFVAAYDSRRDILWSTPASRPARTTQGVAADATGAADGSHLAGLTTGPTMS
jgi:hypothetical protein